MKHTVLIGITLSLILLLVAASFYPGGSTFDKNAVGFDWGTNYLCNLFDEKAVNGADNGGRFWAITGLAVLCISFGLFFNRFSQKIVAKTPSRIIRYFGIGGMVAAFFVATPLHDVMVALTSSLALLSMFYIVVFVFRSKLHGLKVLSSLSLLITYFCNFVYYTQYLIEWLPVIQKVTLGIFILWILGLEYLSKKEDFPV